MIKKEQSSTNGITGLAEEVAVAEQALLRQREQKANLEKQIQEAVQAGNVETAKSLRQQLTTLDASIAEDAERLLRLATAKREAELPAAEAERDRLAQVAANLRARYNELRTELEQADFAFYAANQHAGSLRHTITDAKREIAAQDARRVRMAELAANPPKLAWRR